MVSLFPDNMPRNANMSERERHEVVVISAKPELDDGSMSILLITDGLHVLEMELLEVTVTPIFCHEKGRKGFRPVGEDQEVTGY